MNGKLNRVLISFLLGSSLTLVVPNQVTEAATYSRGSRSYSSGSRSSSSTSGSSSRSSSSSSSSPKSSSSSSKSYSSPSSSGSKSWSWSTPSSGATRAKAVQESQAEYQKYKAANSPSSERVHSWTSQYGGGNRGGYIASRATRQSSTFSGYSPAGSYSDSISPFFWGFLLSQSLQSQAAWAYHHKDEMSEERYRDLVAKNAALGAELEKLKGQEKDPNYTPKGVDPDLMYKEEVVAEEPEMSWGQIRQLVARVLGAVFLLGGSIWLVFFKKWRFTRG